MDQERHVRVSVPQLKVRARYATREVRGAGSSLVGVRDGARRVTCSMGCGQRRGPPRTTGAAPGSRHFPGAGDVK